MSESDATLPSPAPIQPLDRAQRHEIQRWYEQAVRLSGEDQHDEVDRRLQACLRYDPGNSLFVELFLRNLDAWRPTRRGPSWLARAAWRRRVGRAQRRGDWVAMQQMCLAALTRWRTSEHGEPLRQWARCCAALDQLPAALLVLQHAEQLETSPRSLALAAQALTRLGRFDDARHAWRQVLEADPDSHAAQQALQSESPRVADAAVPEDPTDAGAMLAAVTERVQRRQWTEAQQLLQQAMSASPGHLRLTMAWEDLQLEFARDQIERAEAEGADAELREELAELLRRLELEIYHARSMRLGQDPQWRVRLAEVLLAEQRWASAEQQLSPLPEGDWAAKAARLCGEAQQRQRKFDEALASYTTAASAAPAEDPEGARARRLGAALAEAMGQPQTAARWRQELGGSGQSERDRA